MPSLQQQVHVRFGRVAGSSVQVDATGEELLAVAAELEARGRHPLAERLRAIPAEVTSLTVTVSDYDMPMLVAAMAAARRSVGLGHQWARVRDL